MNNLQIEKLSKSFGRRIILKEIEIECHTGTIVGIFGRNGCGKSTLFQLIYGIQKADSISIKINSKSILQNEIIPSKTIAYLPQNSFLPKELKVREIIPFFFPDGNDQDKIFYTPQVSNFEKTKVGNLSLGQLRYFELLIIANLNHPFIMLDEPFSMIEPIYKDEIKKLLLDIKKTKGILITDHYYNDVLEITDKNLLINNTKIMAFNTKEDLIKYGYLSSN